MMDTNKYPLDRYLTRDQVPDYILDTFGPAATITSKTLAKLAVTGGGPEYIKFGRRVAYSIGQINAWVNGRAVEMKSTSEVICDE